MLYKINKPTFIPAYDGNLPTLDHIFPQILLKEVKIKNPETNRYIMKYSKQDRDQIANIMVLSQNENCAQKRATPLDDWFADKDDNYLQLHMIPSKHLLQIDMFEKFLEKRKEIIISKLRALNLIQ